MTWPRIFWALAWVLALPALAQAPLSYADILARVRPTTEQVRLDVRLAEYGMQLQDTRGFLREGPTVSVEGAARRPSGLPAYTDKAAEIEFPLFLAPRIRGGLEASLGQAHPLLVESVQREAALRVKFAYLEAWLAQRTLALREADLATVERWLSVTQRRAQDGQEPSYQVDLVEGERLKAQQDLDEARTRMAGAWAAIVALADVPATPVPLADPGAVQPVPEENIQDRLRQGPLRRALEAQADLETRSLRLKEAQAQARWSLRTSYGTEAEDHILRLGVSVRLPRPGEGTVLKQSTDAQIRVVRGELRQALAELDARILGVWYRFHRASEVTPVPDFSRALATVEGRLASGQDQPSEAFPIRRQLLEAQMAALRRIQARHALTAEIQYLLP